MPAHIVRGNATRARSLIGHVFATEGRRIGPARATARITPANLVDHRRRLTRIEGQGVPA